MSELVEEVRPGDPRVGDGAMPLVLMYHSVTSFEDDPYLVTVTPRRFDEQLRWMRRCGLRGVSVRELLRARSGGRGRGLVGLTFDDGYTDFVEQVVPALQRWRFTATVFVVAGRLGGYNCWDDAGESKTLMTADQVRRVAACGMEIGSHGLRHVSLTSVGARVLTSEVGESRAILQEVSGQEIRGFCYPYGSVDAPVVDAVQAAGYEYGCAIWRSGLTGPFALPRTYVGDRDQSLRLVAKWCRHRLTSARGLARGDQNRQVTRQLSLP